MIHDILKSIFNIKPIPKNKTKKSNIEIGNTKMVICIQLVLPCTSILSLLKLLSMRQHVLTIEMTKNKDFSTLKLNLPLNSIENVKKLEVPIKYARLASL